MLETEDTLYTISEVAKRLRVDTTTVRRWIGNGILDAVPLPHKGRRTQYRVKASVLGKVLQGK